MSDTIAPAKPAAGRAMPGWLKGALLAAVVFLGCWGGAVSYWRTTSRMPGTGELALFLVGLPVFVLFTFWLSRKLLAPSGASPAAAAQANNQPAALVTSDSAGLAILAASLRLPHGTSPDEFAEAIAGKKARPDLDPELLDDDGFPVMTARSSDAVDEALQEEITEWLELNGMSTLNFSDEQWRAVTLATAVTEELAGYAGRELRSQAGSAPRLRLIPMLPTEWPTEHRHAVGAWLKQAAGRSGWQDKDIDLDEEVLTNADTATPSAVFGSVARDAAATDTSLVTIVVACSSNIGNETIANWAANGTLFTSANSKGDIPGEGAAGLLVSDLRQAQAMKGDAGAVLDEMMEGRLDSSADEAKRINPKLVRELTERALKHAAVDFSNIGKIVADTDHQSNRMLELMSIPAAMMPQLDETEDVLQVGISTGACGDVAFIAALALARHHVLALQGPVLAISNRDPYRRLAALIRQDAPSPGNT